MIENDYNKGHEKTHAFRLLGAFRASLLQKEFNHPSFSNPNSTFVPGSTSFGTITSTAVNNRQVQFGLKVLF
ncbi:MAG: hypothetical protein L0387_07095 [Acidobacteria bacterium]|nr:hypothetical protein [Acidobacteriota bacterium]MCI0724440.1 hypothetical protein [Acidobacteriota bacterium]